MEEKLIEIVSGKSIGGVTLGSLLSALPGSFTLEGQVYRLEQSQIRFTIEDNQVNEIWLEDLRKTALGVSIDGVRFGPSDSLDRLRASLGPCVKVPGIKGGVFLKCKTGLLIGTDPYEGGSFVQVRIGGQVGM